jgi:hypothetical protein
MYEDGEQVDKDDERTLWRTLFLTRICRIDFAQPHFWIIDAIDECNQYSKLFPILYKITEQMPLRIFITSRLSPRIDRLFAQEKVEKISVKVQLHQTLSDIRFYIESNSRFLLVASDKERQLLIEQIIQKSNGSFLWVHLVLKALEDAHTEKQIKDCLLAVPDGMNQIYQHILQDMLLAPKNIPLAQAILRWVICTVCPLTIDELREALRLDINETISQLENTIGSVCGNLLSVDSLNRVQPVCLHGIFRELLLLLSQCSISLALAR